MAELLTYQEKSLSERLEKFEWDRMWIEDTTDKEAKRVLYIGDSISNGTFSQATVAAERKILFNNFASSKALDNPFYYPTVKSFIEQCQRRDAIIFNNGLHGWHLAESEYGELYLDFVKKLREDYPDVPLYIVLTTATEGREYSPRVIPRNDEALKAAEALGLKVIDLYSASIENAALHTKDGVHFTPEGYAALGKFIVDNLGEI